MRNPFMVEFMGTPEAGKTTSIERLQNVLSSKGYKVMRLQESAERLPEMQFMEELFPDLVIALTVSPEVAIERRGGEGRLVTEKYIEQYNEMFYKFYQEIDLPKTLIETSKKEQNEVCAQLLKVIEEHLLK